MNAPGGAPTRDLLGDLFDGLAVIMPLQIRAPEVAFPRLNALALWLLFFGSVIAVSGHDAAEKETQERRERSQEWHAAW